MMTSPCACNDEDSRGDVTASVDLVRVLEEPLTVAQQKLYLRLVEPARLDFSQPWYGGDPWVGTFAKLLFNQLGQHFDAGGKLDEALMRRSARICAQLKATSAILARRARDGD